MLGLGKADAPRPTVKLLPESWLRIDGSSNVNDFRFRFTFEEHARDLDLAISVRDHHMIIHPYTLRLPIREFKCNNVLLRNDFRETLKYRVQPEILIQVDSLQFRGVDAGQSGQIETIVQIGGVQQREQIRYRIRDNRDGILNMEGRIRIDMADYRLDYDQKFMGLIQVEQQVDITFLFNFEVNP
jgi:hypothetical protein